MIADAVVAVLLLASAALVLAGALGLASLPDFFTRMHAPSLAYTLGSWLVTLATIVHFSVREEGISLHAWLIIIILSITAPVTTMLLARAALFRQRQSGQDVPAPLGESGNP